MFNKFTRILLSLSNFIKGYIFFISNNKDNLKIKLKPIINDYNTSAKFDPHYLYQGSWIAKNLKKTDPEIHHDFGSDIRLMTSLCHYHRVVFNDIFLPNLNITNFNEVSNNLYKLNYKNASISSISCLHVLEHVGLGRYGDNLYYDGHVLAVKELKRVLKKNGNLFISTPIGKPTIYFNAHRVFSYEYFLGLFNDLELLKFEYLSDDANGIYENYDIKKIKNNKYGCGFFWFKKL